MKVPNLIDSNKLLEGKIIEALTYIDLFCGAGGFSLGFDKSGFQNIFSIDIQKDFCETYQANFPKHKLIQKDITQLENETILELISNKKVDVIIGGPPCQGFSIAGSIGRKFIDDPRNRLFKEFVRVVAVIRPKYFVMENVARLYTHNKNKTREEIIKDFNKLGYKVECEVLNSADYGVPQIRKRVIFLGSRVNHDITFPIKTHTNYKTVKDALDDLPKLNSGEESTLLNHKAMKHTAQMLHKMSFIKDGGTREHIPTNVRPKSGDVRKYIKYNSAKPSITITGDMRKVFHYSQNRALTVRELARLQTFPDSFEFKSSSIAQQQQVGNAVPPLMAAAIAKHVKNMIENSST
ncbi:DNA (cytosine-5-)-methyltransferase [Sulfurimonas sp.]|uniref:DNA cytosine methyltransferase n=1 Tax=Sulfurimonas sp. TaxID=2022749 RepID=UPI0025F5735B|nr:DNA (cytosine-5-)-methyltransferase [Sulfurimonas sp.]